MTSLFYRHPRLLVLTLLLLVTSGLLSLQLLPRVEDPRLVKRVGLVITRFPGAPAERVESLVTKPLEDRLREVETVSLIDSRSRAGISVLQVELDDALSEAEVERQWSRVRDKVADAKTDLPDGATDPLVNLEDTEVDAYTLVVGLVWQGPDATAGDVPYAVMLRRAEILGDRLRNIAGTKQVALFGRPDEELAVQIDAATLAHLRLTADDLAAVLAASDPRRSAGVVRGGRSDLQIEVAGQFDTLQRIRDVPVRVSSGGQAIRLGDIAAVDRAIASPPSELAFISGRPAVVVAARMDGRQRIDQWRARTAQVLDAFAAELPATLTLQTLFDQNVYVARRLNGLFRNFLASNALVMLVTLALMGVRSALVVGLALPLSSLMVLTAMRALALPLHQMSVTGLIIALGILIDNAIIVVDDVRHRLSAGAPAAAAVGGAVRYLAVPLLASTLTTVFSFAPIALMPGPAGEFVGPIAVGVILALVSSFLLSVTIVPALAAMAEERLPVLDRLPSGWWRDGWSSARLEGRYTGALGRAFAQPWRAVGTALVLPLIGFGASTRLSEQFFPPAEREQFQLQLRLPGNASIEATVSATSQARERLLADPAVADVHWFAGRNAPKFYYNMQAGDDGSAFYAQALVELRSLDGYFASINRLQRILDEAFPDSQFVARQLEQGPPFGAPVEVFLYGSDLAELHAHGERLRGILAGVPGVTHTRTTLEDGVPRLDFTAAEAELRLAGLTPAAVAGQLQSSLEGSRGGLLLESTEQLPVSIRVTSDRRRTLAGVSSLTFRGPGATTSSSVPATAVGTFTLVPAVAAINRRDGMRVSKVQGFIEAGRLPSAVLAEFEQRLAAGELALPAGMRLEVGGESRERNEAVGNLLSSVGILLVLMVATLVLSLGSFRLTGVIFAVAALSAGTGFLGLWLFGYPFGFTAITGIMGLVGLAINTAIIVLAGIRSHPAAAAGDPGQVLAVVLRNTRHIVATTLTTIVGFLPLIVGGGGFWPPMAVTICGGVLGGTLLGLLFAPGVYLLMRRTARVGNETPAPTPAGSPEGVTAPAPAPRPLPAGSAAAAVSGVAVLLAMPALAAAQPVLTVTLPEAVSRALAQNPDVQVANLAVAEAEAGFVQTRARLLPQVDAVAVRRRQTANLQGAGLTFPGFPTRIGPFDVFDARPRVSQAVLDVGAWRAAAAARARIAQARSGEDAVRQATALGVIGFFLQAVEIESRRRAGEGRLDSARAVERQVRAAYEAGTASRLDLSRATLQVQAERSALHLLEGSLAATRQGLLRLMGVMEPTDLRLAGTDLHPPAAVPSPGDAEAQLLRDNPELVALRHAVTAARAELERAHWQRAPRLSVVADYGVNGPTVAGSLSTYQYAGVVEWPILTGGRIHGEIAAARARLRTAEAQLLDAELRVRTDLRAAWQEGDRARQAAEAAAEAVAAARQNLNLTRERYQAGVSDSVSVLQAQASLADAENLEIGARVQVELARARVAFAAGDVMAFLR